MKIKIVSWITLTMFLTGMFTMALSTVSIQASLFVMHKADDYPTSNIDGMKASQGYLIRRDFASASNLEDARWSSMRYLLGVVNDHPSNSSLNEPIEIGVHKSQVAASYEWDFESSTGWRDFAYVVDDSAELVIGVNGMRPNYYSELVDLIMSNGGTLANTISMDNEIRAVVADMPHVGITAFISEVEVAELSSYIEPNVRFKVDLVPNDPDWLMQWGPRMIEAEDAWDTQTGDPAVLVAIIDTGVDWNHPDLIANYVPLGYDWVNNDPDPMDDHGHGTHCAGVIAATINNSIGIAGLAQVRIMAEKGLGPGGGGWSDDLAKAIVHAVDQGADILSNSWGGIGESTVVHEAVKYAHNHGVLVIGAAGNDATDSKHYPAAYDEVVAVTATDQYDDPASFTNFGDWIELAAPGVHIFSTVWDDSYASMSGTSMSAPHVSGVAALFWSQFPSFPRDQVRAQLRYTADDLGDAGFDVYYGYGRINARRAVEQAPADHDVLILSVKRPRYVNLGSQVTISSTILNMGTSDESSITVQLLVNDTVVDSKIISSLVSSTSASMSCSWIPTVEGVYNVTSYVVPVPSETATGNNALSAYIWVRIPKVVRVPDDYEKIQDAVDAAIEGDTIFVASGTYYEHIWINKENLTLVGENRGNIIIDGGGSYDVVCVTADNVKIDGFTIQNSGGLGAYPPFSGILLYSSDNHTISNTTTSDNCVGIGIFFCTDTILRDNDMTGNMYNFGVEGYHIMDFIHDIDISNTVDGKPIYYWVNQRNSQFPTDAGYVAAIDSSNITMKDLNLTNNYQCGLFAYSANSIIENVNASGSYIGIHLIGSCTSIVVANNVTDNQVGIKLQDSNGNNISHNNIAYDPKGLSLYYSHNNTISYNNASNNNFGLFVEKSDNNTISSNRVFNNTDGIYLRTSDYNALRNNNMTCNEYNFGVSGNHLSHFIQDIDTSNTVDGKPVYYWVNQKNRDVPADAGYVAVVNSTNIVVRGLHLTNNVQGVLFAYTSKSLIENANTSNNTYSIYLYSSCNNTIINNIVTSKDMRGVQLISSNNNTISNNMITNNYVGVGLWLSAENNLISENEILNGAKGGVGLYLDHSSSNTIGNNTVAKNDYGIELYLSGNNSLRNNNMTSNSYNFGVYSQALSGFIQDIDTSNTVDGKPTYYWLNLHNQTIPTDAGYIAIINSTSITMKNLSLTNNLQGVLLAYTTNSTIMNVIASRNYNGIYLWSSDNNTISGSNVTNNEWDGIDLYYSGDNIITGNKVTDNGNGIDATASHKNVIDNNVILENIIGIMVYYSDSNIIGDNTVTGGKEAPKGLAGISLTESKGNVLSGNFVSDNRFFIGAGIYLEWSSNNNTIIQNTITNNYCGLSIGYWGLYDMKDQNNNNTIYHNNLMNNTKQAFSLNSINTWDDGYDSGGNYWSDYVGVDLCYSPYQNLTGSDGIGDEPFVINADNKDRYPLMGCWPPLIGDMNSDGKVDIKDISIAAKAFGSYPGHPRWAPVADINKDNKIDIRELAMVARNFGKTWQHP